MNTQAPSSKSSIPPSTGSPLDPFDILGSSLAVQQFWLRQPERLAAVLQNLALDAHRVHDRFARNSLGITTDPVVPAVIYDPVSYTHLDVYKRQPLKESLAAAL